MGVPGLPLIDSHLHLVDFLQDSDGMEVLLRHMDAAGVERAVLFGMPLVKKWEAFDPVEPHYYLDDEARCYYYAYTDQLVAESLQELPAEQRRRFAPLICGFNPTDRHGVRHIERLMRQPGLWRGVGEVLLRHDDLTNLTQEETARANHPAMMPVYAFCEEHGLPILLHQNSTSVGRHDHYVYLHELEEALSLHPRLTVVWGHCGLSRRVFHERYHAMVDRMLSAHPGLHVDTSWVGFDDEMCARGLVRPEWIALVERHADRFMIGSDLVGHFDGLGERLRRYDALLQALSPQARRRVAGGNAARIFFGDDPEASP
ncbi:amidohydrolase family protein [Cyanobium sp. NIES-981]|uniref:amidohydrolase family protein n=1 Tax=Cyanobium sp. NIES-981 TaxID=1851505 RepID=UPI0007DD8991|nr:amidohydrolase family protein [Cyanobium sp. NIES-981]SBO43878.1 Amidohydrolase 2 [Cyanobium sp. NIES-981]